MCEFVHQVRPLAVTMGEPAGIGGEILCKAWARRAQGVPPFVAIDDPDRLAAAAAAVAPVIGQTVPIHPVATPEEALTAFADGLPVLIQRLARPAVPGQLDPAHARAVIGSIERAVALVRSGQAGAVVTNPIHKKALYDADFHYPGHTEFLAALAGPGTVPVMMLACPGLRVVPVTIHVSLSRAIATLTTAGIVSCGRITAAALRSDFGLPRPRLAVAALNPHAGEAGTMGDEEGRIIVPAIEALRREGIDAFGPAPADTLFHSAARAGYDAVLCMYHDQALIPLKTIDFAGGVNVTLGLPFVRTSPDHGTALDIAGTGRADEASLMVALSLASEMAIRRARALDPAETD